jgi:hypothetical protein
MPAKKSMSPRAVPPVLAPVLMMAFWMLLGAAAGIRAAQSIWLLLGWGAEAISVAVPVGGIAGAAVGAALGRITNPRRLVLLMAVFAGASAGGVAGKVPWGDLGEIGGQIAGGLVGGIAWAAWLFIGHNNRSDMEHREDSAPEPPAIDDSASSC